MVVEYVQLVDDLLDEGEPPQRAALMWRLGRVAVMPDGDVDAVIDLLRRAAAVAGEDVVPCLDMLLGLALHARFRGDGLPADLDAAAAALDRSLPRVPVWMPWRSFSAAFLVESLRLQAADAGGLRQHELLGRAIDVGEQEIAHYAEDPTAAPPLRANLAFVYYDRWRAASRPEDTDHAIRHWRAYFATAENDIDLAIAFATVLLGRAYRRGDPVDAAEAIALLQRGVDDADGTAAARQYYWLGLSYLACWELDELSEYLPNAFTCFESALQLGLDDDATLDGTRRMIMVAAHLHIDGADRYDAIELRRLVDDAEAMLHPDAVASPPGRAELAVLLAVVHGLLLSSRTDPTDVERIRGLLALAEGNDLEPRFLGMAAYMRDYLARSTGAARSGHVDTDALKLLLTGGPNLLRREGEIAGVVGSMLLDQSGLHGDLRGMQAAVRMMRDAAERSGSGDLNQVVHTIVIDALHQALRGDMAAFADGMRRATALSTPAAGSAMDPEAAEIVALISQLSAAVGRDVTELPPMTALPTDKPADAGAARVRLVLLQVACIYARNAGDLRALHEVAHHAATLLDDDADHLRFSRLILLNIAADAERGIVDLDPGDTDAARRAAHRYAEACALAGDPQHPNWAALAFGRAYALRRSGEPQNRPDSRRIGRSALYGQAWSVVLQAGTDYAIQAARSGAELARTVAGWCIEDASSDPAALDDLVAALDLGRGQVLRAATYSRGIARQLADAGHRSLADEWSRADASAPGATGLDAIPDVLRLRVLHALHPEGVEGSALMPVAADRDVREALGATGMDALVYLVEGYAVVVRAAGGVDIVPLPELRAEPARAVSSMITTPRQRRDLTAADAGRGPLIEAACRWAWRVAIQPLLAHLELDRPTRLVLVPTGPFGLVPWHAAFDDTGAARRYALNDVVFSYAVSAERFCTSAGHTLRQPQAALIVGDPTGDLPHAGIEARAIHQAFHPHGHLLERATPDDVLRWFAMRDSTPSAVHFACHGRVHSARPADAELMLWGGTLAVRRLIEETRHDALQIDQVFLAACSTSVTGDDYDEAMSIATAFIAAGARTVFGALWIVPDSATSLLMFMLHHFLRVGGYAPVDALRAAQLWMLDPVRTPPPDMPYHLAVDACSPELADPLAWAAFTHTGR